MQERSAPAIKYFGDIISGTEIVTRGPDFRNSSYCNRMKTKLGSTVQEIDLTGVKLVLPKTKFSIVSNIF